MFAFSGADSLPRFSGGGELYFQLYVHRQDFQRPRHSDCESVEGQVKAFTNILYVYFSPLQDLVILADTCIRPTSHITGQDVIGLCDIVHVQPGKPGF